MELLSAVPAAWRPVLAARPDVLRNEKVRSLPAFVATERATHQVNPGPYDTFAALKLVRPEEVRVVIVGQDPYPDPRAAHGLAFSVPPGVPIAASLRNILRELADDLGVQAPATGTLDGWAAQGVLLLNRTLTCRAHEPGSHRGRGWEEVTGAILSYLGGRDQPARVFLLWGKDAQEAKRFITLIPHRVLEAGHPSPLSASRGFFGSKPFSKANQFLQMHGQEPIAWERVTVGVEPVVVEQSNLFS